MATNSSSVYFLGKEGEIMGNIKVFISLTLGSDQSTNSMLIALIGFLILSFSLKDLKHTFYWFLVVVQDRMEKITLVCTGRISYSPIL